MRAIRIVAPVLLMALLLAVVVAAAQSSRNSDGSEPLKAIGALASWKFTPDARDMAFSGPSESCNVDPSAFSLTRLDHEISPEVGDRAATDAVETLKARIVRYLQSAGWLPRHVKHGSGIPDMSHCYEKNGSIVQVFKTTGRCTMNSPCNAFDGLTVIIYEPASSGEFRPPMYGVRFHESKAEQGIDRSAEDVFSTALTSFARRTGQGGWHITNRSRSTRSFDFDSFTGLNARNWKGVSGHLVVTDTGAGVVLRITTRRRSWPSSHPSHNDACSLIVQVVRRMGSREPIQCQSERNAPGKP